MGARNEQRDADVGLMRALAAFESADADSVTAFDDLVVRGVPVGG